MLFLYKNLSNTKGFIPGEWSDRHNMKGLIVYVQIQWTLKHTKVVEQNNTNFVNISIATLTKLYLITVVTTFEHLKLITQVALTMKLIKSAQLYIGYNIPIDWRTKSRLWNKINGNITHRYISNNWIIFMYSFLRVMKFTPNKQ